MLHIVTHREIYAFVSPSTQQDLWTFGSGRRLKIVRTIGRSGVSLVKMTIFSSNFKTVFIIFVVKLVHS